MDATCHWTCPPTTTTTTTTAATEEPGTGPTLEVTTKSTTTTTTTTEKPENTWSDFCNGASDMLMLGFDVSGKENNPCVILFFNAWTLDEPWKFALGCVGVALMGVAAEALIWYRRYRQNQVYTGSRLAWMMIEMLCYAASLMLGYLAMLVAMTYSVELFLSVCLGLVVGHVIFNLSAPVGETADPCCQASQDPNGTRMDRKCRGSVDSSSGGCGGSNNSSLPSYNSRNDRD